MPRRIMGRCGARMGVALMTGLPALVMGMPAAHAQRVQTAGVPISGASAGMFPYYRVAPGLNLQQAAYNTIVSGAAYAQFPPYALGYAPPYALGYSPFGNPGVAAPGTAQAIANSAALNPNLAYLAISPAAYANPYSPLGNSYGAGSSYFGSGGAGSVPAYDGGYGQGSGYSGNPYSSYGRSSDPFSGYLRGAAGVLGAQGQFKVSMRQADLLKEQRVRERIENRKRLFDEYLYEKKHTPTYQQLVEDQNRKNVARWTSPGFAPGEIWSATALNALMDEADRLQTRDASGPDVPLDAAQLQNINVGPKGDDGGNAGLLKDNGKLRWPIAFRTEPLSQDRDVPRDIEAINSNLPVAVRDAVNKSPDASVLKVLGDARDRLAGKLAANIADLPPRQYMQARRFLEALAGAIRLLEQGQAGKYLGNELTTKARTVKALVTYMKEHGLEFKPTVDGQEQDYAALHHALAAYDIAARGQVRQVTDQR